MVLFLRCIARGGSFFLSRELCPIELSDKPYIVGFIFARGGSKGVPGKNIKLLAGKPLIGYAVQTALECPLIDRVVVSTDDPAIADAARRYGAEVPFIRPAELAQDDSPEWQAWQHAIRQISPPNGRRAPDVFVSIPTTAPLRSVDDVERVIMRLLEGDADVVLTVRRSGRSPWFNMVTRDDNGWRLAVKPNRVYNNRQEAPPVWDITTVAYAARPEFILRANGLFDGRVEAVEIPPERAVDIDSVQDFEYAEWLMSSRQPSAVSYQLSAISYQLSAISHQPSAISYQPSAISHQPSVISNQESIQIGDRIVGKGQPCFIIAEAGVNHNGDLDLARRMIDVATDSGADAVKFQTFKTDKLVAANAPMADYQIWNSGNNKSQGDLLKPLELSEEAHRFLQQHCRERGIVFLSTPFDGESAAMLNRLGVPAFKLPSGELTNHELLQRVASFGKPLIISTGMADMNEVVGAVEAVKLAGNSDFALLHCVSGYPADPAEANLRAMQTLREQFGCPVGFSDHTEGIEISIAAAAMGANVIEKHFTLDRTLPGPDQKASLEPGELRAMVAGIRKAEAALGDGVKRPTGGERNTADAARRSLVAAGEIATGTILTAEMISVLRPGTGLPPAVKLKLVGRKLRVPVRAGMLLSWEMVE